MSARQLIVLVVAAIAAVGALLVIRGMGARSQASGEGAPVSGQQVLVAARDIGQGVPLTPSDLAVATFPDASIAPTFVRLSTQPSAQTEFVGAVTRRAFTQGEPITTASVVQPDGRGFMAAQLAPGFRAVAIEVEAETAAGGFIQPNDHVDVIATSRTRNGANEQVRSHIVLEDVRVLAIGDKTQGQSGGDEPETIEASVAVLELTAEDARTLAQADEMGNLSLALRGVQVETVGMRAASSQNGGLSQQSGSVRIHAYGNVIGGGQ